MKIKSQAAVAGEWFLVVEDTEMREGTNLLPVVAWAIVEDEKGDKLVPFVVDPTDQFDECGALTAATDVANRVAIISEKEIAIGNRWWDDLVAQSQQEDRDQDARDTREILHKQAVETFRTQRGARDYFVSKKYLELDWKPNEEQALWVVGFMRTGLVDVMPNTSTSSGMHLSGLGLDVLRTLERETT